MAAAVESMAHAEGPRAIHTDTSGVAHDPLHALCLVARLHQVAAEPAALRHALGKGPSEAVGTDALLQAARHLGLKARRSTCNAERLAARVKAWDDGAWVRDAALAHARKQSTQKEAA